MEAYSKKLLLLISIALLFSACADMEVTIKGYNRINVDTNYTYVAAIENDDKKLVIKNYTWSVSPQDSRVTLSNVNAKELHLNTSKAGDFTLHLEVNYKEKTYTNDMRIIAQKVEVLQGHTLPPEPDPKVNNSSLLGIDSNNNGVRDDVEIWIYETYKDKHPIYIDIAMQAGRAYKLVLEHPERAREIHETVVNAPLYCAWYYQHDAVEFGDPLLVEERIDAPVKSQYFNTSNRSEVYWEYDGLLSGGSYPLPKDKDMKNFCDFDTSKYDKK